jgi:hypothetical protein
MKSFPMTSLAALALAVSAAAAIAGPLQRPVVVELYTSQGCSSCPPADALLGRLAHRPGILAMSLPITYWDMLGWKDTLASDANTRRQKAYAAAMGHGAVYTPQMIIDGASDVVGSREAEVEAAIAARAADAGVPPAVPVALNETPEALHVTIGAAPGDKPDATVWLFHLRAVATVNIGAGENDGRTMTYHNVVGDLRAVGLWKGQPMRLDVPRAAMEGSVHDAVAVVVQQGGYGHVIGAAYLSHPDYYAGR